MGLEQLQEEILERAQKHADKIVSEAQKEVGRIESDAQQKVQEYKKEREEHQKTMKSGFEKTELAAADFAVKKSTLDKKKEIIENVFTQVAETLQSFDDKKRTGYLVELYEKASKEIDVGTVYVNKQDLAIAKKIVSKGVSVKEQNILGGLIAETADGRVSADYSFEEMLGLIKERDLQEVTRSLFG